MVRIRARIVFLALVVAFFGVTCRMSQYAIFERSKWQGKAITQQQRDVEVPAMRGTIYDSNMEVLVQSAPAWSVSLEPDKIPDELEPAVVEALSQILGVSQEYIWGRIDLYNNNSSSYRSVKLAAVKADKTQRDAIKEFIASTIVGYDSKGNPEYLDGILINSDTQRYYFQGNLASHVLGFTGTDNIGLYGVEAKYDHELSGVPGRVVTVQNAWQGDMPVDYDTTIVDAQQGNSLVLTIDATVQAVLEKYLSQAVEDNLVANRACGIVMNVNTGAVLAMSTMPDYDPSNYQTLTDRVLAAQINSIVDDADRSEALINAQMAQWNNKAISDTYEPGSVFKPITMAAALEEGKTSLGDAFFCPGYKVMGGVKRSCHKTAGHGSESLTQAMMNSCNPVFMTLAERLGASLFYSYFEAFGFTERTGIDLPAETLPTAGVSYHTESSLVKSEATLAACSFGQANTVTPIQMATAIAAVSNGGYLVTPHIVDSIIDSDGNLVHKTDAQIRRQVISQSTSDAINEMLEKTVSGGTGKNGYVAGYRVGGKTGTSEKLAVTIATGNAEYVASYCAIAPSDDPEIVILIMLDEPRGASHMGGTIAAPVARNVLTQILPYLGVETIYSSEELTVMDTLVPDVVGLSVDEARTKLREKNLNIRILGSGGTVVSQTPRSASIPKGSTVIVSTEESVGVPQVTVPNVVGMNPSQANSTLVGQGLNIRYTGTGYDSSSGQAVKQDIAAGTSVVQGTVVTVEFIMSGATD